MTRVMSDQLILPPRWASGLCPRGHDVTNPDNVGHNVRQQFCRPCYRMRQCARRRGETLRVQYAFPTRYCERCGGPYEHRGNKGLVAWSRQRYCSLSCASRRRRTVPAKPAQPPGSAQRSKKLSAAEIERLRRLVGFSEEWTA